MLSDTHVRTEEEGLMNDKEGENVEVIEKEVLETKKTSFSLYGHLFIVIKIGERDSEPYVSSVIICPVPAE